LTASLFREPDVQKMREERDVDGLVKALKHKDRRVREDAVEALREIKDPRAVETLIQAMKDKDITVRAAAALALEKIKAKKR